ncbi:flagellin N-terminal helical domain-containing protein [Shewanella baltica]|uniref:Flagellin n=1 Tax=Shewanella baltica (strain OS195) TaxID=399599 RepID=A9KWR1_SHEB9|nr:flagellin [Shewanella baltica]ABS09080.1 flagellin domain protein [Shewanella baltica OS185]ABX50248.1 flagellin domain protein [Shewanella baltica OS195]ADT95236.1 flagellin domain protein [Shewanella baltica OS678]EHC06372.1 flagellin domain protein [Shewanella baltica OS625]KZK65131.1 flagellin [Shewanella baltica]
MAITVNTNVTSMKAQKNLNASGNALATSMERLSSGLRINSAKDDAAGLAISNRLNSQVRGLDVGMRNANDGISVAQIAEGAMQEQTNMLQRMRDLSVQAVNGANSTSDKDAIQAEIDQLALEITAISNTTAFGDTKLLSGGFTAKNFQVGHQEGENISISISGTDASTLGVEGLLVSSDGAASTSIGLIDTAIKTIDTQRAKLGATQNRLSHNISNSANTQSNVADAKSRIVDVDFAKETSAMTKNQVLQQTGSAMLAQANQLPQVALSLL